MDSDLPTAQGEFCTEDLPTQSSRNASSIFVKVENDDKVPRSRVHLSILDKTPAFSFPLVFEKIEADDDPFGICSSIQSGLLLCSIESFVSCLRVTSSTACFVEGRSILIELFWVPFKDAPCEVNIPTGGPPIATVSPCDSDADVYMSRLTLLSRITKPSDVNPLPVTLNVWSALRDRLGRMSEKNRSTLADRTFGRIDAASHDVARRPNDRSRV
jgi:hypothetical protein